MHDHKDDHDIYRAGRLFLDCPEAKAHIIAIAQKDVSFLRIFEFMAPHEKASGFLLNAAEALDAQRAAEQNPLPKPWQVGA
jgi:hypothetical protein